MGKEWLYVTVAAHFLGQLPLFAQTNSSIPRIQEGSLISGNMSFREMTFGRMSEIHDESCFVVDLSNATDDSRKKYSTTKPSALPVVPHRLGI